VELRIARTAGEVSQLEGEWKRLYRSGDYTLFQCFEWNLHASEILGRSIEPLVVAVRNAESAVIIPAATDKMRGDLCFLGGELFDYRDLLCSGDPGLVAAGMRALDQASGGLPLRVQAVRESSRVRLRGFALRPFAGAPYLIHPAPRHPKLDRSMRRLLKGGCEMRVSIGKNRGLARRIYDLKASADFRSIFRDRLQRELASAMAESAGDACEIFTLEQEETIVAALVTYRDGKWRRFYTTYFDPHWAKLSPGISLLHHVSHLTLEAGLHCDYMTGEQPFKQRLANGGMPLYVVERTASRSMDTLGDSVTAA
jgi:CelD/BcsL family acetyltransferase involved in cellulose biosynthesis